MKRPEPLKIARGFARNEREAEQLSGITTIYRADKGETLRKFKMRPGELLGVVNLRVFGETRYGMVAAVKAIHEMGAAIVDLAGLRSDRDGAEMLDKALVKFVPSAAHAREMQRRSVLARTTGRMGKRDALIIWRNPRFSTYEALDLMRGWSQRAAYLNLGPRLIGPGRRPKRDPE